MIILVHDDNDPEKTTYLRQPQPSLSAGLMEFSLKEIIGRYKAKRQKIHNYLF